MPLVFFPKKMMISAARRNHQHEFIRMAAVPTWPQKNLKSFLLKNPGKIARPSEISGGNTEPFRMKLIIRTSRFEWES